MKPRKLFGRVLVSFAAMAIAFGMCGMVAAQIGGGGSPPAYEWSAHISQTDSHIPMVQAIVEGTTLYVKMIARNDWGVRDNCDGYNETWATAIWMPDDTHPTAQLEAFSEVDNDGAYGEGSYYYYAEDYPVLVLHPLTYVSQNSIRVLKLIPESKTWEIVMSEKTSIKAVDAPPDYTQIMRTTTTRPVTPAPWTNPAWNIDPTGTDILLGDPHPPMPILPYHE